jgi:hypothetical protein
MTKLDSEDLLAAWQVLWGQLDPKWHPFFINDPLVKSIIWYDSEFIYPSLKKFQKLSDVLSDIQSKTIIEHSSVDEQAREDFLRHIEEKDSSLEKGKKRKLPKATKPDSRDISPIEVSEPTMEELRYQRDKRHWW